MFSGFRSFDKREPGRIWFLMDIGDYLDTLSIVEYVVEWYDLTVYFSDRELISELRVYSIGEVYWSSSLRKGDDIPFWREDKYLIRKYIHMHLLHELSSFETVFDDILDSLHPVAICRLHGLPFLAIVEVGSDSDLGLYMHIRSTYLDLCRLGSYLGK